MTLSPQAVSSFNGQLSFVKPLSMTWAICPFVQAVKLVEHVVDEYMKFVCFQETAAGND